MSFEGDPGGRLLLPVVLAAYVLYGFDANVVNVAIPDLQRQLGAGPAALELVVGGYVFTYAAGVVTGGRLGDLFGHRRLFLAGVTGFAAASLLCGLAQGPVELVAARMAQGLAAAAMVPQILALVTASFTDAERSRALAWYGVAGAVSGVGGQVLGGLLLDADVFGLGWRAVFLATAAVGVAVAAVAARVLPRAGRRTATGLELDVPGAVGISGALGLALLPLVVGHETGWPLWSWLLLAASVPALTVAVRWERSVARGGGQPLVDPALFRTATFATGLAVNAAFMASFSSCLFVLSLLLQAGLGLSPLWAGLAFAPMGLLAIGSSLLGRRLVARLGPAVLLAGCAVTALSFLTLAVTLHTHPGGLSPAWLVAGIAGIGAGNGLILPSLVAAPLAGVPRERSGVAAGVLTTTQQFAGVSGVAVLGAVFFARLGTHPDRGAHIRAAESAFWLGLALVVVMTALVARLVWLDPTRRRGRPPATASVPRRRPAGAGGR
ncbi:MFS transporter [Frankia sp. QA3]|uniref:MFS transporter n=1 Tax=Frankia sp. QA3 TaxID=710111 RepID=UPI000269C0EF|nr:MFS transporter [Frankia sp. QA3]EIV92052.1 sugar phosphate permease [Frankia sp. QA3]